MVVARSIRLHYRFSHGADWLESISHGYHGTKQTDGMCTRRTKLNKLGVEPEDSYRYKILDLDASRPAFPKDEINVCLFVSLLNV